MQIDIEKLWPGLSTLNRKKSLLVPTDISWRRAHRLVRAGLATIYPFHQRWQGRIDITDLGRSIASRQS